MTNDVLVFIQPSIVHSCLGLVRHKMFAAKRAIKCDISSPIIRYLHSAGTAWRRDSRIFGNIKPPCSSPHHTPSPTQLRQEYTSLQGFGRWLHASSDASRFAAGEARAAATKSVSVSATKATIFTPHKSLLAAAGHYYKCYYELSKARLRYESLCRIRQITIRTVVL